LTSDDVKRNKDTFRLLQLQVIVGGRLELLPEVFAPSFSASRAGLSDLMRLAGRTEGPPAGDAYEQFAAGYRAMTSVLADQSRVIEELEGAGDTVWARWRVEATHAGPFLGIAPTGRRVSWTEVGFLRFDETGRITDGWFLADELNLALQLGIPVGQAMP
jgi:predicted ester cyclase